jgi:hypothetical protein
VSIGEAPSSPSSLFRACSVSCTPRKKIGIQLKNYLLSDFSTVTDGADYTCKVCMAQLKSLSYIFLHCVHTGAANHWPCAHHREVWPECVCVHTSGQGSVNGPRCHIRRLTRYLGRGIWQVLAGPYHSSHSGMGPGTGSRPHTASPPDHNPDCQTHHTPEFSQTLHSTGMLATRTRCTQGVAQQITRKSISRMCEKNQGTSKQ